jgi:tetratricopeptide (TPR) repeat protein
MPKKTFLILIILCISSLVKAQTTDDVYNLYLDFNLKKFEGDATKALQIGEQILPNVDKLPAKSRMMFYNGIAKLYEDDEQFVEAIPLYEKVAAAQPDYYVAHRALGYLYLKPADALYTKLQASPGDKEIAVAYKVAALKALPHLEKAQACDPSDETLATIKTLYTNIHDEVGLRSLNARLKGLSKSCLDILSE